MPTLSKNRDPVVEKKQVSETIRDRLWKKAAIKKVPLAGAFELLPVCNFSCQMCYVRKTMEEVKCEGGLLPAKEWLRFASEAGKLGMLYPLLTGGEPILHPDFKEIYVGMQQLGMQVSINTNGSMIDFNLARWLGLHMPIRVNVTLYGASEHTYERVCGQREAYEKVCQGIHYLKENKVPVKLNTSIIPQNADELQEIIAFAKNLDMPLQVATYMFPPIRRDEASFGWNHRLTAKEAGQIRVKADFLQNDNGWFLKQASRYSQFVPLDEIDFNRTPSKAMKMSCRAGACSCWIDWQGNLMNCGMYASCQRSLLRETFAIAWSKIVEETLNLRYTPACAVCPNVSLCHSCIAMVHNECGRTDGKPEYLCRMNEAAAKYYKVYAAKCTEK